MTDDALAAVERWAQEQLICPRTFRCPHYDACNESLREATLYGNPIDGHGVRLAMVGLDHGWTPAGTGLTDFKERRKMSSCTATGRTGGHLFNTIKEW